MWADKGVCWRTLTELIPALMRVRRVRQCPSVCILAASYGGSGGSNPPGDAIFCASASLWCSLLDDYFSQALMPLIKETLDYNSAQRHRFCRGRKRFRLGRNSAAFA